MASLTCLGFLINTLNKGEHVSIDTHWGGLGGGTRGVRVSGPLVYLVLTIAFALLFAQSVQLGTPAARAVPAPATKPGELGEPWQSGS